VISDPRPFRRCWPSGAIHLLVGFPPLLFIERLGSFDWRVVEYVIRDCRPEDVASLLFMLAAIANTVAGFTLIVFPMRWRGLLLATLTPAILVHLWGVLLGVVCVIFDDYEAQWGGLTAMLGVIVAVPCFLMMLLGMFAAVRIARSPRSGTPELACALSLSKMGLRCLLHIHLYLQKANRCLQRLLEESKPGRKIDCQVPRRGPTDSARF
jgi:hypothetical protein